MGKFKPISFNEALPRLVATYGKGKLVPFTGSGISAPSIPTWDGFIKKLSPTANRKEMYSSGELVKVSERVVTKLQRVSSDHFIRAVKKSLGYSNSIPSTPKQCHALAKIWWPLIISTNYDRLMVDSYLEQRENIDGPAISVFGRSARDCHSLLSTLNTPLNSSYWALQGYFGKSVNQIDLEKEIVVGYRQYRNVTFNNPIFRATFSEVFRNYSLFFLGSGLSEEYFMGLFGEVLEKLGTNPHPHFALFHKNDIDSGKVDPHFLHTKLNIIAGYYTDRERKYDGLQYCLDELGNAINSPSQKFFSIGFGSKNFKTLENVWKLGVGLEILAGTLPFPSLDSCSVLSVGLSKGRPIGGTAARFVDKMMGTASESLDNLVRIKGTLLWQKTGTHLFFAAARNSKIANSRDARDLRVVSKAVIQMLNFAQGRFNRVDMMLLAAGKGRIFPPIFSFIEMIRGYRTARKKIRKCPVLRIHVVDPSVIHYFRRNPIEIEELLNCDDVRLLIEINMAEEIERCHIFLSPKKTLREISDYFQIDARNWNVSVFPNPFPRQKLQVHTNKSIEEIGLIPGSTIRYTAKIKQ